MIPKSHPLIESLTEPLAGNAERRVAANGMLEESFDPGHPAVPVMLARLEATGTSKRRTVWKIAAWLLASLSLGFAIYKQSPDFRILPTFQLSSMFSLDEPTLSMSGLTEKERLVLSVAGGDELEQKRRLHFLEPENPAYFAEFAHAYVRENGMLPPDFLETAALIDPDNSFFLYWAAGLAIKGAVEKDRSRPSGTKSRYIGGVKLRALPIVSEYTIKDPAAYGDALRFLEKAATLPSYQSYISGMIVERVRLIRPGGIVTFVHELAQVHGTSAAGVIEIREVRDILSARAEELSKSGRTREFLELAEQRDAWMTGLAHNKDNTLVGELVYAVCAAGTATNFHAAAERLGLLELAETYRIQSGDFLSDSDSRQIRHASGVDDISEAHASTLARFIAPMGARQVQSPPAISDYDLEPMRRVEHEFLTRLGLTAAALLILPAARTVSLFRFIVPPVLRLPAMQMTRLLGPADWCRVLLLGVALPIVIFLIITRLTPLGGRDYGVGHFRLAFPGTHLVALLLGLLIAPAFVVRRRLARWFAPFGAPDRLTPLASAAALALALFFALAAFPALVRLPIPGKAVIAFTALPALGLCLIFANLLRTMVGKPIHRLAQATTAIAVLPAYAAAIVALCLLLPMHLAAEKQWLTKETHLRIDPHAPDLGAFEFKVAAQKRKETNAIMGFE